MKKYCLFIWPYDKRTSLSFLAPAIFLSFHVGTCWHKNESSTPCTLSIVSAWHSHQFSTRISPFFPLRNFCMCVCVCVLNSAWTSMQAAHISGFHYKAPQSFFSWSSLPNPAYTSYTSLCGYTVSATTGAGDGLPWRATPPTPQCVSLWFPECVHVSYVFPSMHNDAWLILPMPLLIILSDTERQSERRRIPCLQTKHRQKHSHRICMWSKLISTLLKRKIDLILLKGHF